MAFPIPFGWANVDKAFWGTGPGNDTGAPIYRTTVISPTPSEIATLADLADQYDMTIFVNLAGARGAWTDDVNGCKVYNEGTYTSRVNRFRRVSDGGQLSDADFDTVTSAFARRRFIGYPVDEPNIGQFCDSISKQNVNNMGLLYKEIWPGCLTAVRAKADSLIGLPDGGFAGTWSGIDYGWFQFGKQHTNNGLTKRENYDFQRSALLEIDMGMVPAFNWQNGGDGRLWDCNNNNGPDCRLPGGDGSPYFLCSPQEIMDAGDAIFDDPDAIAFTGYQTTFGPGAINPDYNQYEIRSDFVAAFDYVANKLATRTTSNGFRQAKGTVAPPPPPAGLSPLQLVGVTTAVGDTITSPTPQAGDLIVVYSSNEIGTLVSPLPSGWSSVVNNSNVTVAQRLTYRYAVDANPVTSTWGNASGLVCFVLRNAHPTAPFGTQQTGKGTGATVTFPGVTLSVTDKTSKVLSMVVHDGADNLNLAPAGMSNVGTSGPGTIHLTDDGVDAFSSAAVALNGSGNWRASSVEVFADPNASADPVAPSMSLIGDKNAVEGAELSFTVTVTDADTAAASLTFTVEAGPGSITSPGGVYSYTPGLGDAAASPYSVTLKVCDDTSPTPLCDQKTFSVTVTAGAGGPPVLNPIGSKTVKEQKLLSFTAAATDPDTDPSNLVFSLAVGAPAWASIDSSSGAFLATPPAGAASGSPYSVTVQVSDGTNSDSETISITVTAPTTYSTVRGGGISTPRQRGTLGASST